VWQGWQKWVLCVFAYARVDLAEGSDVVEPTRVVRKRRRHPEILVAVDPDLELTSLEVWNMVTVGVSGLPEPSVNVTNSHVGALALAAMDDKVSREGYLRVWRAVYRDKLALVAPIPPREPRLLPPAPYVAGEDITLTVSIPWERTCVAYHDHASRHIVRDGVAICPSCRDALVVIPDLDVVAAR
jgi:hypothetical protein